MKIQSMITAPELTRMQIVKRLTEAGLECDVGTYRGRSIVVVTHDPVELASVALLLRGVLSEAFATVALLPPDIDTLLGTPSVQNTTTHFAPRGTRVRVLHHWFDIWYAAMVECVDDLRAAFKVYRIVGRGASRPLYELQGSDSAEPTDDLSLAQLYLHGETNADGSTDFAFDEQKTCMLHTGNRIALHNHGLLLGRVFDASFELMRRDGPPV